MSLVVAQNLSKTYATDSVQVKALQEVSFDIEASSFLAFVGPSGSGKTTLLNLIGCLDKPTSGNLEVAGVDVVKLCRRQAAEFRGQNIGFIFQSFNLIGDLTVYENVELPLLVGGVGARAARERAILALEQVHLAEWAGHRPLELSGGQRQRVTIARALVNEPAIVWGDEPTGDLDSTNADEIMQLMIELNERNQQTFVIVTHDPRIAAVTHRIVYMVDGLIVDEKVTERAPAR